MIEKINLIRDNRDATIVALNVYLDKIYNLTDSYFDNGVLKKELTPDEKLQNFLLELRDDAQKFEAVRKKIIDNDFNLSLKEINYVALAFIYLSESWQNQIKNLTTAREQAQQIIKILMGKSNSESSETIEN